MRGDAQPRALQLRVAQVRPVEAHGEVDAPGAAVPDEGRGSRAGESIGEHDRILAAEHVAEVTPQLIKAHARGGADRADAFC